MRYILASTKIIKGKCSYPYNIIKKTTFYKKMEVSLPTDTDRRAIFKNKLDYKTIM